MALVPLMPGAVNPLTTTSPGAPLSTTVYYYYYYYSMLGTTTTTTGSATSTRVAMECGGCCPEGARAPATYHQGDLLIPQENVLLSWEWGLSSLISQEDKTYSYKTLNMTRNVCC